MGKQQSACVVRQNTVLKECSHFQIRKIHLFPTVNFTVHMFTTQGEKFNKLKFTYKKES